MWVYRLLRVGAGFGLTVLGVALALSLPLVRDQPWLTALVAAGSVAVGWSMLDAWRTDRLLSWLRAPRSLAAPHEEGSWGDLTYRIERIVELNRRELKREQARLADFLEAIEASPNGVLLLDANEQIAWLNTQAAAHFDLNPHRDLQQRITNLVRKPEFVQHLQQRVVDQPLLFSLHNGRSISVLLRQYGEGAILLLSQDVSERERTEAMRRDFVANVSHEIRTPLAALSGFVESLATLNLQGEERSRVLELMRQQSVRMQALVDDLLTLARLEGSPRPSPDSWFSLDALLGLVMAESQGMSGGRHQFAWPQPCQLELAGTESEMHSAITNLVSNAVRYTPAQGRITVTVGLTGDGSLTLQVNDTGPGISAEHLPRLTERFYRVDSSRSRITGGTGLGLSIVKHVCQRHGGQLRVDSELGVGSSFTLIWPALRVRGGDDHGQALLGEESAPSRLALLGRER